MQLLPLASIPLKIHASDASAVGDNNLMPTIVKSEFPPTLPCKIAILAEAPGVEEDRHGRPLIGSSGKLLDALLRKAGIDRATCYVGNVFSTRPPQNDVGHFFITQKGYAALNKERGRTLAPPMRRGSKILHPDYAFEIDRLKKELQQAAPNIVICLGAVALWAVAGYDGIRKYRGNIEVSDRLGFPLKFIGTYHPANILRQWDNKIYLYHDLMKAKASSETKDVAVHHRTILVAERLADIRTQFEKYRAEGKPVSYDIETDPKNLKQITMIGFSNDANEAFVIPFIAWNRQGLSYWPTASAETEAKCLIAQFLSNHHITFIAHNSNYDREWLLRNGIAVPRYPNNEDTMLMHHSMEPELKKGLDTLSSLYLDEKSWKHLADKATLKSDE